MVVNRYTAPVQWAQYSPLSMQELAYAPQFLRQRHDMAQQGLADLEQASNEYDVLDKFSPIAGELVQPFQQSVQSLAEQLASQGVQRSQAIPQAMKLKSQYNQLFGQSGAIGQLQARTQQYREAIKQADEQFKDEPLLQRWARQQIQAGEARLGEDGKLQLGEFNQGRFVRHIPEAKILDRINDAVSKLKPSDIQDPAFGKLQKYGSFGSFEDLWRIARLEGVEPERIQSLIKGMLAPEELQAVRQFSMASGLDPETGVENFLGRIANIGESHIVSKMNERFFQVKNEDALNRMKRASTGITYTPGPLIQRSMQDILEGIGLEFDKNGEEILEKKSFIDKGLEGGHGKAWEFILNATGFRFMRSVVNDIIPNLDLTLYAANPTALALAISTRITAKEQEKQIKNRIQKEIKNEVINSVKEFKKAYPEMESLTTKDAYNIINEARNQFQNLYSDVVAPQDADFTKINRQVLGTSTSTGDFERRQIFVGDQKIGTGDEFYKRLGYKNFAEFKEKGMPQIETGVTFGAKQPAAFVGNAVDSKGNPVTFTIQSNKEIESAGRIPNKMLSMLQEGKFFQEMTPEKVAREFGMQLSSPNNNMYFFFDVSDQTPYLVEGPKNMSPFELRDYFNANPQAGFGFAEAVTEGIQDIFYRTNKSSILSK